MKHLVFSSLLVLLAEAAIVATAIAQTPPDALPPAVRGGTSNIIDYPPGTRIYSNGGIHMPNGQVMYPNAAVPRGDGSTTYYYPNGTRIDLNRGAVDPSGSYLEPGTVNGGLTNNSRIRLYKPPTFPGSPITFPGSPNR
jgi:hypothetical protein